MPIITNKKGKADYDISRIAAIIRASQPEHVCLEAVHSMPGQGVSSVFAFGRGYGILLGVVVGLGVPLTCVAPRTWKSKYLLNSDKNLSRQRATELFPECSAFWKLKKHDGLAEAAILAHYICSVEHLDAITPSDIFEMYGIERNVRVKTKQKPKR